jgi:predicted ATP-dependent endonuclease of OLD family
MFIAKVHIENFRNFSTIDIPLKPFTIIVGKNDTGKSNLIEALNIVLYNSKGSHYIRSLSRYDFNSRCVDVFESKMKALYEEIKNNFDDEKYVAELINNAPMIIIRLRFEDANSIYEQGLLKGWMNGDENFQYFEIEYRYFLKDIRKLDRLITDLGKEGLLDERHADFQLFLECYASSIISTSNGLEVDNTKMRNFAANTINAERDSFSGSETANATRIVSNIINSGMNYKDKTELSKKYNDFFNGIQSLESFRSIYDDILAQNKSIESFIKDITLVPNAKKYKDILDNITISYGDDMLFQRGLGTRNLIFLLTLYSYFLYDIIKRFNLVCIEEPESHLDINNLKVATDFFHKAQGKNTLTQLIISTHSNQIMNKLELENVVILSDGDKVTDLAEINEELVYYLSKRENFDTLNMFYANKLIMVEGATEEIYINTLLDLDSSLNSIRVISIGQKGFRTFIEAWKSFHDISNDKLGIVRDYDNEVQAKKDHEAFNSDAICVKTSSGKEFEYDLVSKKGNLDKLNSIFNKSLSEEEMYDYMISDKLVNIISVCRAMNDGATLSTPDYINSLLKWIIK